VKIEIHPAQRAHASEGLGDLPEGEQGNGGGGHGRGETKTPPEKTPHGKPLAEVNGGKNQACKLGRLLEYTSQQSCFIPIVMKTSKLLLSLAAIGSLAVFAIAADAPAVAPAAPAATSAPAPAPAPFTVTLSDVHICCGNCIKGVATATASLTDVKAVASQDGTIVITTTDKASAQKAVDALTGAGFFGKSSDASIKVNSDTGAKSGKVATLAISNLHLCCGKCVTAVKDVLTTVPGVSGSDVKTNAKTFTVSGDFDPVAVFAALQKAGLTGKAGATTMADTTPAAPAAPATAAPAMSAAK
jgi:copper chaperone CopZ